MTKAEKKAIEELKLEISHLKDPYSDDYDRDGELLHIRETLLNLIDKQQKEIEELRKKLSLKCFDVNVVYNDYLEKLREFKSNSIPKSKIKAHIYDLEQERKVEDSALYTYSECISLTIESFESILESEE